jgi:hypothetical protein
LTPKLPGPPSVLRAKGKPNAISGFSRIEAVARGLLQ